MNIHFRQVTQSDINKFPVWYERIGGDDLLWFIISDNEDEIGTIWFERKDPNKVSYDLGIYLNRIDLFGKAIGRTVIKSAMDTILSEQDIQELYLDVRKENIRAIRCYESLGFRTIQLWEKSTESGKIKVKRMKLQIEK